MTGILLSAGVLITRLPFISRMLYEFDSVDFAVATFRFSLEQVTPHFPGYILHILFAKFLLLFLGDLTTVFVWISMLLSVGSELFLWRAVARLRGERAGVIAAVLWLFLPIFWFYGEVATAYMYEAFFASALLFLGISLLRTPDRKWIVYILYLTFSLSIGARQSSIIFFSPAFFYLLLKTRPQRKTLLAGKALFLIVTAIWLFILISYSGGVSNYFSQAGNEVVYKSQSVIFGNSLSAHLAVIAKVVLYLMVASLPLIVILGFALITNRERSWNFIRGQVGKTSVRFVLLLAFVPFLFYLLIYFMKAGYLLNVIPSLVLCTAVLIDQLAIWRAEKIKRASADRLLLTRPIITVGVIRILIATVLFELIIFFTPFPWLCENYFDNSFTGDSFQNGTTLSGPKRGLMLNRLFSFNTVAGVKRIDNLHHAVFDTLSSYTPENLVLLDTWWHRWGYYYLPQSTIYDIRDFSTGDSLWIGKSRNYFREVIEKRIIRIPSDKTVLLLLRNDHPAFSQIASQVHLERIGLPKFLDIYRISDGHFSFRWKDVLFIK